MRERWEILADLINKNNYKTIVELGVSRGINAYNVLRLCPGIEEFYLVDITFEVFDEGLFAEFENKIFKRLANIDVYDIAEPVDLVFIDGEHSYEAAKKDIHAWIPKIRKGGVISGHDYMDKITTDTEVKKAVDEIFPIVNLEDDILENGELKIWWVQL